MHSQHGQLSVEWILRKDLHGVGSALVRRFRGGRDATPYRRFDRFLFLGRSVDRHFFLGGSVDRLRGLGRRRRRDVHRHAAHGRYHFVSVGDFHGAAAAAEKHGRLREETGAETAAGQRGSQLFLGEFRLVVVERRLVRRHERLLEDG